MKYPIGDIKLKVGRRLNQETWLGNFGFEDRNGRED